MKFTNWFDVFRKRRGRKYYIPYVLDVAFRELGTAEIKGKEESNPQVEKYLETVGLSDDMYPWCSAFVNWCVERAGYKGTGKANARSWLDWGRPITEPKPGDIVILKRGIEPWQGHVAFFLDIYGGYISLLGGNQRDRVGVNKYSSDALLGYRRLWMP